MDALMKSQTSFVLFLTIYLLIINSTDIDNMYIPLTLISLSAFQSAFQSTFQSTSPSTFATTFTTTFATTFRSTRDEYLLPTLYHLLHPLSPLPTIYLLALLISPYLSIPQTPTIYALTFLHTAYNGTLPTLLPTFITSVLYTIVSSSSLIAEKFTPSELYFTVHLATLSILDASNGSMEDLAPENVGIVGLGSFLISAFLSICIFKALRPPSMTIFIPYVTLSTSLLTVLSLFLYMHPTTNPIAWILELLLSPQHGLQVLWYVGMGALLSTAVYVVAQSGDLNVAVKRKLYHIALLLLFLPTLTPSNLPVAILSTLVGTCVFLLLEILRYELVAEGRRDFVGEYWENWIDDKDRGGGGYQVVISPITLLLSPILPSLVTPERSCTMRYIGLIVICIGDTMAAAVGVKFGKHKIPFNGTSKRTVEGTLACFISVLLSVSLIRICEGGSITVKDVTAAGIVAGVEAGTTCIDNVVLPVVAAIAWAN